MPLPEIERLVSVMARLRQECPWDAQQTHRSLAQYLVEETAETIEAIESGDVKLLRDILSYIDDNLNSTQLSVEKLARIV